MGRKRRRKAAILQPGERLLPVMDLKNDALVALEGARYHLHQVQRLMLTPGVNQIAWRKDPSVTEDVRRRHENQMKQFHWHLRAFFWELVATWDTLLQWANQTYGFGLREDEVTWASLSEQARRQGTWPEVLQEMDSALGAEWPSEVLSYRNFAHRSLLFVQGDYGAEGLNVMWLMPVCRKQRMEDLREQLPRYLEGMRALLTKILKIHNATQVSGNSNQPNEEP